MYAKTHAQIAQAIAEGKCICCGELLKQGVNVFTELGWRETEISGLSEKCFDAIFEGMDDED